VEESSVTLKLPDELRSALVAHPGVALELVDEQTRAAYVLMPAEEFQRLKTAMGYDLEETYRAQIATAMAAGWDDPRMDAYNDYDAHRGQR
jgi:hypothetical protein